MSRPPVSVVVPFLGDAGEAECLIARIAMLELSDDDELIVADNTADGLVGALGGDRVTVVATGDVRSASHARNLGGAAATGEWLLFIDADCIPPPDLVAGYFADPPDQRCGVLAGEVEGDPSQRAVLARWARSRRGRWVSHHLAWGPYPAGVTANLLVRRSAFEQLHGFRIGGGGDLDLCWRAQQRGWGFGYRPRAVIHHRDRETIAGLAEQAIAYGGHQRRLRELYGSVVPRPSPVGAAIRALGGAAVHALSGRFEAAAFKLIDGLWAVLERWGWLTAGRWARKAD